MRREKFSYDPPPFGKKSWEIEVGGDEKGREKEKSRGEKLLDEQLRQTQELIKSKGISFVDEDCRLDLEEYKRGGAYTQSEIMADERRIEEYKRGHEKINERRSEKEKEQTKDGERFEKLKTIIFNKFLGENFVTVRTSMIDDIDNGIDNIIINKETNEIVGALDEVCSDGSPSKKRKKLNKKMREDEGGELKYGLKFGGNKIVPSEEIRGLPIFYLQINHKYLKYAMNELSDDINEKTEAEEKIFKRLINSMYRQSHKWKEDELINPNLQNNFSSIYKTIKKDRYLSSLLEKDN